MTARTQKIVATAIATSAITATGAFTPAAAGVADEVAPSSGVSAQAGGDCFTTGLTGNSTWWNGGTNYYTTRPDTLVDFGSNSGCGSYIFTAPAQRVSMRSDFCNAGTSGGATFTPGQKKAIATNVINNTCFQTQYYDHGNSGQIRFAIAW